MSSILPKNLQSVLVTEITTSSSIIAPVISTSNLYSGSATIPSITMTGSLFATHTNNTIANIFTTNGNVGIATSSPGARLDVSGTIRATTSITTGSVFSTNQTSTNSVLTNLSSGTIVGTTISSSNIYGSLGTINNLVGVNLSSTNLLNTSATISNINTSSVRITNGSLNATFNSNTVGNIFTTGGNVGINTTSPGSRLEVNGTLKADDITVGNINFTGNLFQNGSAYLGSQWTTTSGNTLTYTSGNVSINSGLTSSFNSNTVGPIITTGGNVGIGTSTINDKLTVSGNIHATNGNLKISNGLYSRSSLIIEQYGSNFLVSSPTTGSNLTILQNTGGGGLSLQPASGNIGIGTTSASTKLHVEDGSAFIGDSTYFSTSVPSAPGNLGTPNGYRLFFDNTINQTAGSGMPANKIVLHNNNWTGGFGIEGSSVTYHSGYSHTFYGNATNTSTYGNAIMMINGAGRVGIMTTSPDTTLHINGNGLQMGTSTNAFHFFNSTGSLYMLSGYWNNGSYIASFTSTANVGIGNTAPAHRLDVSGTIRASAGILLSSSNVFEFGHGISGKHVDAGKIGYNTWTTGLNIIGAATTGSDRLVYIYDHLQVATSVTIPNIRITGTTNITGNATIQATTNNYSLTSGALNVTGDIVLSGSELMFTNTGIGTPTMNGRGAGSKIVLYPGTASGSGDYSLGIENLNMWFQVPISTSGFKFYQGTTASMVISTNGNVGIGTISPLKRLHVYDNTIAIDGPSAQQSLLEFYNNGTRVGTWYRQGSTNDVRYYNDNSGTNILTFGSTGNVGIGNTSPTAPLQVFSSNATSTLIVGNNNRTAWNNAQVNVVSNGTAGSGIALERVGVDTAMIGNVLGNLTMGHQSGAITFNSGAFDPTSNIGTERMRITATGTVGIGTSTPVNTLDISGTLRVSSSRGNAIVFNDPVTGTTLDFFMGNRGGTQLGGWTTIDPNGGTSGSTGVFIYDGLWINASNQYVFNSTGLGIGTTSPQYLLDVNGTIDANLITTGNLSNGTATIGTLLNTTLINYGRSAQWVINGGGVVTWTGSSVLWSARVIIIPVKRSEYSTAGFMDIGCPTSGTITYYNSSNVTTTVTCTASGIPIGGWDALYYEITPGQTQTSDQTRFRLVDYNNTTWQPTSNWILLAVRNGDNGSLKWIPGNTYIASGATFNPSAIFNSGGNIGIGTTSPVNRLDIQTEARTGTHGTNLPVYVTGNIGPGSAGLEVRHSNGTQGVGLGYNTIYATGSNTNQDLQISPRGTGVLYLNSTVYASGDITAFYSDRRLKTNLQTLDNFDEVLSSLTGYTFNWNEIGQEILKCTPDESEVGLIAQDVQAVIPQAVKINKAGKKSEDDDTFDYLSINYSKIVPFLIEGYKSQRNELKVQRNEIDELKSKLKSLENTIEQLLNK